jgi:kynurenine formamidase
MEYEFDGRRARYTHEMPVDAYTGDAVCLDIRINNWGPYAKTRKAGYNPEYDKITRIPTLIGPEHLEDACKRANIDPSELEGMIVCLNTGQHRDFDDSKNYYHYAAGTGVDAGKWFVEHKVKCVAMDSQALDHPLLTAMGNNGMTKMNLLGASGLPITEEYKNQFGEEAYAEFDKFEYIRIHGQKAYDAKFGELEAIGCWGTWEPCHKTMLGHGIVGVENLGGDLDKVTGKRFRFFCFPLRWYLGDGSMARCAAEIDEDNLNDVPDRVYTYGGNI